jgi:DNA replication protein DnaC
MSNALKQAAISEHCRELKMPRISRDYAAVVRQATDTGWDYEDFLLHMLELEVHGRRDSTSNRRIREARFPETKTLEQIDWASMKGVSRTAVMQLTSCEYLDRGDDIVIAGPIGTGKTLLATALGVEAAKRRKRVAFVRAADLVRELIEARDDRQLGRLQRRYLRVDLLICDELGFVPFDKTGGELLFNLLADRYERRSTLITTNLAFGEWVQVFGSEKLTTALLDRLGHHATVLTTKGDSYRTKKRRTTTKQ